MIEWLHSGPLEPVRDLAAEVDGYPECIRDRVVAVAVSVDGRYARVTLAPKVAT